MAPNASEIVIVGGSLSGLFTGIVLKSLPTVSKVTILERYNPEELQDLGAGIRCNAEAIDAILEYTGVPPEKYSILLTKFRSLDKTGVLLEQPTQLHSTTWGQLYRVFRTAYDSDAKCSYRHKSTVVGVHQGEHGRIEVGFQNENSERRTMSVDLVVGADGASSKIRSLMDSNDIPRTAAGYVCYRGVIPVSELSAEASEVFDNAATASWPPNSQTISYVVPGNEAPADEAEMCMNWVWYRNKTEGALQRLMTDKLGRVHKFTLPHGHMAKSEIEAIKKEAENELSPSLSEVIQKTPEPFIQVVTDSMASKTSFFDGQALLVGDAVGGQRPHTASAMLQGTYHALLLRRYLEGHIDVHTWEQETQKLSRILVEGGHELGGIVMSSGLSNPQRVPAFMKEMLSVHAKLNALWKETVGIGNAEALQFGESALKN